MPSPAKRPRSDEIRLTEVAKRLGMTVQGAGQWAARPGAPVRKDGTAVWCSWPAFARWREDELVAEAMPGDLDALRARKLAAEARMAEIDLAQREGEVVLVADYSKALGRVLDLLMSRLRSLPISLSAQLGPDAESAAEVEVERIIVELAAFDEDVLEDDDAAVAG
jgi:hypothetical protein